MSGGHKFAGLIPEMLVRRVREKKCVLFVGAGLSAQAQAGNGTRLPTWKALLERMVDWSVEHRIPLRADPSELAEVIGKGRLLVVAQEIQESLGGQLNACLSDVLHSGDTKPSEAYRVLCNTDWVAVLTSNYDALIEGAYAVESEGVLPPAFSADGVHQTVDCLRNDKFFVFKVHGDLNIPGSIVLGNRDYSRLMYLSPAYRSFLETVFASYTVLFVGFGGNDPDLDAVVDRLSAIYERGIGQHFLLISEGEFSALERRRMLEDKRLDCITYERDADHSQVVEFLKALSVRVAPGADVPTPFEATKQRPRAFISGSYQEIELLRRIAAIAARVGFDTWFAETQISVGDTIADTISKAIDETDCMIVVMSHGASESSWVHFEIGRAWGARKKILPIRIGDAPVSSDLMGVLYLQIPSADLSPSDETKLETQLKRFIDSVRDS